MKTSWSSLAREQADKAHKTEVDALKAKLAQYAASADRCRWSGEPRIKAPAIRALLDTLSL